MGVIAEEQKMTEEINEAEVETIQKGRVWDLDDIKEYFASTELPTPDQMPEAIDLGKNMVTIINKCVEASYTAPVESYDVFQDVPYQTHRHKLVGESPLRVLVYAWQSPSYAQPHKCWPPKFQFLMPILEYNQVKTRRAKGMVVASDEVTLLALRNSETMVLASSDIEPRYSRNMLIPALSMPKPERQSAPITGKAEKEMLDFLEKCKYGGIEIYARKTFPYTQEERVSTTFTKLDWADLI